MLEFSVSIIGTEKVDQQIYQRNGSVSRCHGGLPDQNRGVTVGDCTAVVSHCTASLFSMDSVGG